MPEATIVGGGIAGLSAALRLVERGFQVTVLEQNEFLGGKLGAHKANKTKLRDDGRIHEHCYHMYLNWYHNFWQIIHEIGAGDRFDPQEAFTFLQRNRHGKSRQIQYRGSPYFFWRNIFSGALSPADMLIYGYSLVDLIATPTVPNRVLERTSVRAFMTERSYNTEAALGMNSRTLAEAFACPSELTSARSYRTFINYGFAEPDPMLLLLKGNTESQIFTPLEAHIRKVAQRSGGRLEIRRLARVDQIVMHQGRVSALEYCQLEEQQPLDRFVNEECPVKKTTHNIDGQVILAVPFDVLSELVDEPVFERAPELGNVQKCRSEAMASLDLYFKRRLDGIPPGICVLLDSAYKLTFLDNSQHWPDLIAQGKTCLNVIASDFDALNNNRFSSEFLKNQIVSELKHYIRFDDDDIDLKNDYYIRDNVGEKLFINQVGSWDYRPKTTCGIPNLFIAGDYCQTPIDVVTIEGAVVSGLMAAEEVRRRERVGAPIDIVQPASRPTWLLDAMRVVGWPYAQAAKAVSVAEHHAWSRYKEMFPNG